MSVEMVAFDVAGTVLNDDGLVISAFRNAFEATQPDLAHTWRTMDPVCDRHYGSIKDPCLYRTFGRC